MVLIFVHNQIENSNTFWIGKDDKKIDKVEIDNKILKAFFNSDLKLSQVPTNIFVNNLILFFENEGKPLLTGNLNMINELEEFDLKRNSIYTQHLLEQQILGTANGTWDKGDYEEFVNLMGQVDMDKLPSSFKLKYKIANQKLK